MKFIGKKIISAVLCLCMTLSVLTLTITAEPEFVSNLDGLDISLDEKVKAIVVFEDKALYDLGYSSADIAIGNARYAKQQLTNKQLELVKAYTDKLTVGYQYTNLINGMSVETDLATLKSIERTKGVKSVSVVREYTIPDTESEVNVENANEEITLANELHKSGYDGDGIVIAVLDTGLNFSHEAFQDYGIIDNPTIDQDYYAGLELNASDPQYYSAKVPFAYNYGDDSNDATDLHGHGTHCAGIAAGYAEDGEGEAKFTGSAPAAQLCIMKISYKDTGRANDETIVAAFEDCYALGVDIISVSFGHVAGFTGDDIYGCYADIIYKLQEAGISYIGSAGNEANFSYYSVNRFATVYGVASAMTSSVEYGYTGSPSCYPTAISVASVDNTKIASTGFVLADGSNALYKEYMDGDNALSIKTLIGEDLHVVAIPGLGTATDYEGIDVEGKVALIKRGTIDFQTKYNNAIAAGAIAVVVYNNVANASLFNMIISDMTIPAVFVSQESGLAIIAQIDGGNDVIRVSEEKIITDNESAGKLSEFSSWGVTADLRLMPTISAVGGIVSSASNIDDSEYVIKSGTSMSCPNFAGIYAIMEQYAIEELGYSKDSKKSLDKFVEDLLLSTAEPIADTSVLGQGVGVVNCVNAVNAQYYITDPVSDGLDNLSADGVFTFDVTVKRFDFETAASLDIVPYLYMDDYAVADWFMNGNYSFYNVLTPLELACGETADDDYTMTVNTESGKIEFAAGVDTATVSVTITLSDALMDNLDVIYEYGNYIYGYFYLADGETEIAAHSTFVGFYGDYDSAPSLEAVTTFDLIDAAYYINSTVVDKAGHTLADYGYTVNDMLEFELQPSAFYLYNSLQEKPFGILGLGVGGVNGYYDEAHNAISTPLGNDYFADSIYISPTVMRSLYSLKMVVSDATTGEVVYLDDTIGVRKTIYDYDQEAFDNYSVFIWDGMLYDEDGFAIDYCESGSKFNVEFYATNAHEGAVEHRIDNYCFSLVVDYTAPEFIYHYDAETRTLSYTVSDNYLLQIVRLYDQDGQLLLDIDVSDVEEGGAISGEYVVPDDVTEITFAVADWATNFVEDTVISLDENCTNLEWTITADSTLAYITPDCEYNWYQTDDYNIFTMGIYDGKECAFTVMPALGYTDVGMQVFADDVELIPDEEGVYRFTPTGDTVITFAGIEDITPPEPFLIDFNTFTVLANEEGEYAVVTEPFIYTPMYIDLGSPITDMMTAVSSTDYDLEAEDIDRILDELDWSLSAMSIYNETGLNYIYVYCKDEAGNIGYYKYAVFYDNIAPKIAVATSDYGKTIKFTVYDELSSLDSVTLTDVSGKEVYGQYTTVGGEDDYQTFTVEGLPDGIYVINVIATDIYGNESSLCYSTSISTIPELTVDGVYLAGLPEKTTSAQLQAMYSGNVVVRDQNGKKLADNSYVGTGCTVNYLDASVEIVVSGDVNGDGRVTIIDLVHIRRAMQGIETLEDGYLTAAKISGGNRISIKDYVSVKRHLQGLSSIYNQ